MANRFWVGNGGNWSDNTNHWSASTGGAPNASLPTSADNVYFDANSFSSASQTVTVDALASCLDMDWTGATNTPRLAGSTNVINTYGNITLINAMTITNITGYLFTIKDDGNLTSNGAEICPPDFASIYMATAGKTLTLMDDLTCGIIYARFGTLVTNNHTVNCSSITCGAEAHTLTLGSSTINTGAWNNPTGLTLTANTATINCSKNFAGGGIATYNIVNLTGATSTVSGSNTFATLALPAGTTQTITFTDGTTQTVTNAALSGSAGHVHTLVGTATAGWAISKASGRLLGDYLALSYSNASGGASFYARNNSVNTVGNTGWMFREPVGCYK